MKEILFVLIFCGLFLFFMVDYIKNNINLEKILQKLFRSFLRIEKASLDFSRDCYHYLCKEMMNVFLAKTSFFFLTDKNLFLLQSTYGWNETEKSLLSYSAQKETISLHKTNNRKIGEMILQQMIGYIPKKKWLIFPLIQNDNLIGAFLFIYSNLFQYLRSKKVILLNGKKLHEILTESITIIKEREQNISISLFSSIRDYAFITVDSKFQVTSWNKGAEVIFSCPCGDSVNLNIKDFIDKDSLKGFENAVHRSGEEEVKLEIKMHDMNGIHLITDMIVKKIFIDKIINGYYIIIKDITKEMIWKDNIKRQSMINKSIVENAGDGIMLINEANRIIFLNEKLRNIIDTGVAILGMEIKQVLQRGVFQQILEKIEDLRSNPKDLVYFNLKISEKWYNIRLFPIKSEDRIQGVILFFVDNTEIMITTRQLEEKNRNLIENLHSAKMMHKNLIPSHLPITQKVLFENIFLPSDTIGGDFYYVDEVEIAHKKYYLMLVADVSGHGVAASMLTVLVKDAYNDFRISLENDREHRVFPFLVMLNQKLLKLNLEGSKFVTAFIAILDVEKKTIRYSSAGHPPAILLCSHEKNPILLDSAKSPPTGIFEDIVFKDEKITISKDCRIILYTDGLTDVFGDVLEMVLFLSKNSSKSISDLKRLFQQAILSRIQEKSTDSANVLMDDITVILAGIQ